MLCPLLYYSKTLFAWWIWWRISIELNSPDSSLFFNSILSIFYPFHNLNYFSSTSNSSIICHTPYYSHTLFVWRISLNNFLSSSFHYSKPNSSSSSLFFNSILDIFYPLSEVQFTQQMVFSFTEKFDWFQNKRLILFSYMLIDIW